jgi:hypothetical protein
VQSDAAVGSALAIEPSPTVVRAELKMLIAESMMLAKALQMLNRVALLNINNSPCLAVLLELP